MAQYADLHIHSTFSDGTMTVEQLVQQAQDNNVQTIAITDHNNTQSALRLTELHPSIRFIPGAELDAIYHGYSVHILALGIDPADQDLARLCQLNYDELFELDKRLITALSQEHPEISLDELLTYSFDRSRGGWRGSNYLVDKGLVPSLSACKPLYGRYGIQYKDVAFRPAGEVCALIKKAGGIPIWAHPAESVRSRDQSVFPPLFEDLKSTGFEGVECFHPTHSFSLERFFYDYCTTHDLLVSGGSDFHGDFFDDSKQKLGGQFVEISKIAPLLERLI